MKASDYIVEVLIDNNVTDVFGYPGGSVANFVDSLHKYNKQISSHVTYHEQGAAFAACAYAQMKNGLGVVYATGGPGATNLLTGIGHAYYDSIPLLCITGNVNHNESKQGMAIRQRSFQESDIVSVATPLTKYSKYVEDVSKLPDYLLESIEEATSGRKGPVLLDIPMNVFRENVAGENKRGGDYNHSNKYTKEISDFVATVQKNLKKSKTPCFVFGSAAKTYDEKDNAAISKLLKKIKIPYMTSMIAFDVCGKNALNCGFLGAYGHRAANIIAAKSDLIISIGSRLDIRQVGAERSKFAPKAQIIRVDIDENELEYRIHDNDINFMIDAQSAIDALIKASIDVDFDLWVSKCKKIKDELQGYDDLLPNNYIKELSRYIPENSAITTDVGQNQVWVAQSFVLKNNQIFQFCGGFGSMGYALPATIGAYYGSKGRRKIVCICGDGGFQMNIQELQFIVREQIPVLIVVINNYSLGMIRHFQEMYFDNKYIATTSAGGYTTPEFYDVAKAYGMKSIQIKDIREIKQIKEYINMKEPVLVEICIKDDTYVFPKLQFGNPNYDQQPLLERKFLKKLMDM